MHLFGVIDGFGQDGTFVVRKLREILPKKVEEQILRNGVYAIDKVLIESHNGA